MKNRTEKIVILGASRGLGLALSQTIAMNNPTAHLFLCSRKIQLAEDLPNKKDSLYLNPKLISIFNCDFSQLENLPLLIGKLNEFMPHRIFYVAGGGPFGSFQSKNWKDHKWALSVNFLFPAELLHLILKQTNQLQQITFVGSGIAGNSADPQSASYAAAKHALRGLVTSIQLENPPFDLRLFSPGYIDTPLLPPQAWPRQHAVQQQKKIQSAKDVAQVLYTWSWAPQFKNQHLELDPFSN